jgi:hypothetical protein
VKSLGSQVATLEARNKQLAEALTATALLIPQPGPSEKDMLATVDKKVETVNDRITSVIQRFEAYIHEKATTTQTPTPTYS